MLLHTPAAHHCTMRMRCSAEFEVSRVYGSLVSDEIYDGGVGVQSVGCSGEWEIGIEEERFLREGASGAVFGAPGQEVQITQGLRVLNRPNKTWHEKRARNPYLKILILFMQNWRNHY